jgi:hypothetical protein
VTLAVREGDEADRAAVEAFLAERCSARVPPLGQQQPLEHPALLAEHEGGGLAGVLTYIIDAGECEILTLHAAEQWTCQGRRE